MTEKQARNLPGLGVCASHYIKRLWQAAEKKREFYG